MKITPDMFLASSYTAEDITEKVKQALNNLSVDPNIMFTAYVELVDDNGDFLGDATIATSLVTSLQFTDETGAEIIGMYLASGQLLFLGQR